MVSGPRSQKNLQRKGWSRAVKSSQPVFESIISQVGLKYSEIEPEVVGFIYTSSRQMMSGSCLWISWGGFSWGWVVTWVHLQKQWLPVRPGQSCFWCRHKIPVDTKRLKFSNKPSLEVRNNEQTWDRIFHWSTVIWTRSSSVLVSFDESHPLSILLIWKFLAIQRMQEQQV